MNKKLSMAVAGAVMAFGATGANAGIIIPAGDWTIDIGGNANAYYTNTRFSGDLESNVKNAPSNKSSNMISTGLLPSALGIGGKTRQNDLDISFQVTFFTGINSNGGMGSSSGLNSAAGANGGSLNIRQSFLTFGDKSWGTVKMGRDLGVFGSDAILSDMTLLGVGTGGGGSGSSTLGRIGSGYVYADWVGQIQYASPNWNGFSFTVAAREPWNNSANHDLGFDGKLSYEWAGDFAGKVWLGGITQKMRSSGTALTATDRTASAWEIGGKVGVSGFGLVGYYYDGKNMGLPVVVHSNITPASGLFLNGGQAVDTDIKGGYVQGTYTIAAANNLKLGVSWGESKIDHPSGTNLDNFKNESWVAGAYYPLTKSLNLVAEYTDTKIENQLFLNNDGKAKTMALGAILFF
jgi:predicted porin